MRSSIFSYYIFTYLKNFICPSGVVKILKDPLEEDCPIVAPEISHILYSYTDFLFLLYFHESESLF